MHVSRSRAKQLVVKKTLESIFALKVIQTALKEQRNIILKQKYYGYH